MWLIHQARHPRPFEIVKRSKQVVFFFLAHQPILESWTKKLNNFFIVVFLIFTEIQSMQSKMGQNLLVKCFVEIGEFDPFFKGTISNSKICAPRSLLLINHRIRFLLLFGKKINKTKQKNPEDTWIPY